MFSKYIDQLLLLFYTGTCECLWETQEGNPILPFMATKPSIGSLPSLLPGPSYLYSLHQHWQQALCSSQPLPLDPPRPPQCSYLVCQMAAAAAKSERVSEGPAVEARSHEGLAKVSSPLWLPTMMLVSSSVQLLASAIRLTRTSFPLPDVDSELCAAPDPWCLPHWGLLPHLLMLPESPSCSWPPTAGSVVHS